MKKKLKKTLLKITAIFTTITIIIGSKTPSIACFMLNKKNQFKEEKRNPQTTCIDINKNYDNNEELLNINETNLFNPKDNTPEEENDINKQIDYSIEEIKLIEIFPKIETIDAITEKEKVNKLIRKKEKISRIKK